MITPRVCVALAFAVLPLPLAGQQPVFRADTHLVVLDATVRNRQGDLVTTLNRDAFRVYENGTRQAIALFRREDHPVSLGLLIDNSGSMRAVRMKAEAAALAFARASNPQDEMFVLNFNDTAHIDVPFTSDRAVLDTGIARADAIGGTALRDAVDLAQTYLAEHGTRDHKVLLVITDGIDNASLVTREQVEKQAAERDTMIFAIGLFGDARSDHRGHQELDQLTSRTGGRAYYPADADQIGSVALEIAAEIRNQYTIAYAPTNQTPDGSYRTIRVTASGRERLVVRTRAGYWARADAPSPN